MMTEPTQVGAPNCCSRLEPAPAIMTKPMQNSVSIVVTSMYLATHGRVTLRKTALWSSAR